MTPDLLRACAHTPPPPVYTHVTLTTEYVALVGETAGKKYPAGTIFEFSRIDPDLGENYARVWDEGKIVIIPVDYLRPEYFPRDLPV